MTLGTRVKTQQGTPVKTQPVPPSVGGFSLAAPVAVGRDLLKEAACAFLDPLDNGNPESPDDRSSRLAAWTRVATSVRANQE